MDATTQPDSSLHVVKRKPAAYISTQRSLLTYAACGQNPTLTTPSHCHTHRDFPKQSPSLTDLVTQVLGQSLRQDGAVHDCEQDATATMQLVNHALQNGIPTDLQAPPIKVWMDPLATVHMPDLRVCQALQRGIPTDLQAPPIKVCRTL